MDVVAAAFEHLVRDDDHGQARGTGILLGAGVEQPELAHIDRPGEEVRRHVADERRVVDRRRTSELDALDRLVRRVVDVGRGRRQVEFLVIRNPHEVVGLAVPCHVDLALAARFDRGLAAPGAGQDVARWQVLAAQQVDRDHGELERCAALQEQHPVVVRDGKQFAQVGLRFGQDRVERRRTVADLQHGTAGAGQREQIPLYLLQDRQREHRRSRREVEDALFSCLLRGRLSIEWQSHGGNPCGYRTGAAREGES